MWRTNLNIALVILVTLGLYTLVANAIPQVESEVPEAVAVEIGPETTTEELVAMGERIYRGVGGCEACHGTGTRAPDLIGVAGQACETRVPEMSCRDYLHQSLTDPNAHVVEGFQPIMPNVGRTLGEPQVWALVAFLESQGGEVTVTAAEIAEASGGAAAGEGAPAGAAGATGADGEAAGGGPAGAADGADAERGRALVEAYGCLACHQLGGEGGPVGPAFEAMRGDRAELRRAVLAPEADTAPGFEAFAGTMPVDFGQRMTAAELEALLDFMESLR